MAQRGRPRSVPSFAVLPIPRPADPWQAEAALKEAAPWVVSMDHARRGALIELAVRIGVDAVLQQQHVLKALRQNNYSLASIEMLQLGFPALAEQVRTGEWYAK